MSALIQVRKKETQQEGEERALDHPKTQVIREDSVNYEAYCCPFLVNKSLMLPLQQHHS